MNSTPTDYIYDGAGNRVEKCTQGATLGTCATTPLGTLYWYDLEGRLLNETSPTGGTYVDYIYFAGRRFGALGANGTYFFYGDWLGSVRSITDGSGNLCYSADFYPFGGERVLLNNCPQPYYPFKFAGMERDSETGLDHTQNRQYASTYG